MQIPRMSMITLGGTILIAPPILRAGAGTPPNKSQDDGVRFIELPGVCSVCTHRQARRRRAARVPHARGGFPVSRWQYNARSEADVRAICERARVSGATIMTEPEATFWAVFIVISADPDGYYWENRLRRHV